MEAQDAAIRQACQAKGWELVKVYQDDGEYGTIFNRPKLREMVADSEKLEFQVLLVSSFDRIAWGIADQAYVMRELAKSGVRVAETTAPDKVAEIPAPTVVPVITPVSSPEAVQTNSVADLLDPMDNLWLLGGFVLAVGIWLAIAVLAVFQTLTAFSFAVGTEIMILGVALIIETIVITSLKMWRR